jgi:hypothetical protein
VRGELTGTDAIAAQINDAAWRRAGGDAMTLMRIDIDGG